MKHIYTLIILGFIGLLVTPSFAQEYYYGEYSSIAGPGPNLIEVCGDTTILDNQYQFIYFTNYGFNNEPYTHVSQALLRKEGKKVYYRYPNVQPAQDILLYDYELEVGDSLSYFSTHLGSEVLVYTIDSIGTMVINGEAKKQFFLGEHSFGGVSLLDGYIVEDIGLVWAGQHPLYFMGAGPDHTFLFSCLYQEEELAFTNPEDYNHIDCDFAVPEPACMSTTNVDEQNTFALSLFPNPVVDRLNIQIVTHEFLVKVSDIQSKELLISKNIHQIDLSDFSAGVYFITVEETSTGLSVTKKVVKAH